MTPIPHLRRLETHTESAGKVKRQVTVAAVYAPPVMPKEHAYFQEEAP